MQIYTTLNMRDQLAADHAVNYVEPPRDAGLNPGHNADTEVLIQPGTGDVRGHRGEPGLRQRAAARTSSTTP